MEDSVPGTSSIWHVILTYLHVLRGARLKLIRGIVKGYKILYIYIYSNQCE